MGRNLASLVAGVQRLLAAVAAEWGYGLQATDYRFCTRRSSTILLPVAAMPCRGGQRSCRKRLLVRRLCDAHAAPAYETANDHRQDRDDDDADNDDLKISLHER